MLTGSANAPAFGVCFRRCRRAEVTPERDGAQWFGANALPMLPGPGGFFTDSAYYLGADPVFQAIPHTASTATITFEIEGGRAIP